MCLRMPGDTSPPKIDPFEALFCLYLLNTDVSQEDLEAAMRGVFPQIGEKLLGDRTALVEELMGLLEPKCARCGGTGNIGMISSVRCPEC